jgi:hypothetical protein
LPREIFLKHSSNFPPPIANFFCRVLIEEPPEKLLRLSVRSNLVCEINRAREVVGQAISLAEWGVKEIICGRWELIKLDEPWKFVAS